MIAPLVIGAAIGIAAMAPLTIYLWHGWEVVGLMRRIAEHRLETSRILLTTARRDIAELRPLAEVGRRRLAALAKAKGR